VVCGKQQCLFAVHKVDGRLPGMPNIGCAANVCTVVMVTIESVKNVQTICVKFVFGETKSPKTQ